MVGNTDGDNDGVTVGVTDGDNDGAAVGVAVGDNDDVAVGVKDGVTDGVTDGVNDGTGVTASRRKGDLPTKSTKSSSFQVSSKKPISAAACFSASVKSIQSASSESGGGLCPLHFSLLQPKAIKGASIKNI